MIIRAVLGWPGRWGLLEPPECRRRGEARVGCKDKRAGKEAAHSVLLFLDSRSPPVPFAPTLLGNERVCACASLRHSFRSMCVCQSATPRDFSELMRAFNTSSPARNNLCLRMELSILIRRGLSDCVWDTIVLVFDAFCFPLIHFFSLTKIRASFTFYDYSYDKRRASHIQNRNGILPRVRGLVYKPASDRSSVANTQTK